MIIDAARARLLLHARRASAVAVEFLYISLHTGCDQHGEVCTTVSNLRGHLVRWDPDRRQFIETRTGVTLIYGPDGSAGTQADIVFDSSQP